MTGPECYREAERVITRMMESAEVPVEVLTAYAAAAQVYATLALAASDERIARLEERIRRLEEADEVDGLADRIEAIERMLLADEEAIER